MSTSSGSDDSLHSGSSGDLKTFRGRFENKRNHRGSHSVSRGPGEKPEGNTGHAGSPGGRWRGLLSKRKKKDEEEDEEEAGDNYMLKRDYNLSNVNERMAEVLEIQHWIFGFLSLGDLRDLVSILDRNSEGSKAASESEVHSLYQRALAIVLFPPGATIQIVREQWRSRREDNNYLDENGVSIKKHQEIFHKWEHETTSKEYFKNIDVGMHIEILQDAFDNIHPEDLSYKFPFDLNPGSSLSTVSTINLMSHLPGHWHIRRSSLFWKKNFIVMFPDPPYVLPGWNKNPSARARPSPYVLAFMPRELESTKKAIPRQYLFAQYGPTWVHLSSVRTVTIGEILKDGHDLNELGLQDSRTTVRRESSGEVVRRNPLQKPVYLLQLQPSYVFDSFPELLMALFYKIHTHFLRHPGNKVPRKKDI